jgi:hypothetical protein
MSTWICTRCGGSETELCADRPSIDPRYALGRCKCSPPPPPPDPRKKNPHLTPWPPVQLVAAEHWDPAILEQRRRAEREALLLSGKKKHMTSADHAEVAAIRARIAAQWER